MAAKPLPTTVRWLPTVSPESTIPAIPMNGEKVLAAMNAAMIGTLKAALAEPAASDTSTTPLMGERFQANRNLRERLRRVAVWQEKRMRADQERARVIFELAWRADLNEGVIGRNGKLWSSSDLRRIAETISAIARTAEGYANSTWAKYNAVTAKHQVRFMRGWPNAVLARASAERAAAKAQAHRDAPEHDMSDLANIDDPFMDGDGTYELGPDEEDI